MGACVCKEINKHAGMPEMGASVGVGVCIGASIVVGMSSNETLLLSPLSLDEVMGSKSWPS